MGLWISESGLSEDKVQAGVIAASKVLQELGVEPSNAYQAMNAMLEGEESFDREAADAWENAETAAFRTLFAGMERWPEAAALVYE